MTFPTNTQIPSVVINKLISWAKNLRDDAVSLIAQCNGGSLNIHRMTQDFLFSHLRRAKIDIAVISNVAGVYDALVEEFPSKFATAAEAQTAVNGIISAVNTMIDFLESNLPVDASRYILTQTLSNDGSGSLSERQITNQTQLDSFKADLITFRDAFDA